PEFLLQTSCALPGCQKKTKPVSRHLTGLAISLSVNGKIFVGTGCYHGDALTVYPYTPESIIVEGDYFPAPAIHLIDNLRVNA
ncbi:hypothetical protein O5904_24715, partial [Escherichia coli]|nr:hypothetical protein [Escherichia coli]